MNLSRQPSEKRHRVKIVMKSGVALDFTCTGFSVKTDNGQITSIKWENISPHPLTICLSEVAAILSEEA